MLGSIGESNKKKAPVCVNGTLIITAVPSPAAKLLAMDLVRLNSGITLFMHAESSGEVYVMRRELCDIDRFIVRSIDVCTTYSFLSVLISQRQR